MSKKKQKKKERLEAINKEIQYLRNLNERLQYYNDNLDSVNNYPSQEFDSALLEKSVDSIRQVGEYLFKEAYLKEEAIELYSTMINDISTFCEKISTFCDKYKINKEKICCNKFERYDSSNALVYSIYVKGTDVSINKNTELIKKYYLQEEYKDCLQRADFTAIVNKIEVNKKSIENGIYGEKRTYDSIKLLDDEIKILKNVLVSANDMNEEHDLIVISSKGIFTIEVKYLSVPEIQIMESGIMKTDIKTYGNVVEQSRRHMHSLRRLLKNTAYSKIPIYPMIVFSNDNCDVVKNDSSVLSCYRNNVESIILDDSKESLLDHNRIEEIYGYIKYNCVINFEKPYPLSISTKDFYNLLGDVICNEVKKCKREEIKKRAELKEEARWQTLLRNNNRIAENNRKIEELEKKYTEIKEEKSNAQEILEIIDTIARSISKY